MRFVTAAAAAAKAMLIVSNLIRCALDFEHATQQPALNDASSSLCLAENDETVFEEVLACLKRQSRFAKSRMMRFRRLAFDRQYARPDPCAFVPQTFPTALVSPD